MPEGFEIKLTSRMRSKTRCKKKQKAGYLYTRNAKRGAWINSLFWSGPQLLNICKAIPWESFEYKGEVLYTHDIDNNETFRMPTNTPTDLRTIPGILRHSETPYEVFGGAACELWSTVFPTPPIRKYVDPTADIDIKILPFNFELLPTGNRQLNTIYTSLVKKQDAVQVIHTHIGDRYTAFGNAYTTWLFEQTVAYCRKIAKTFQQANLVLPEKANNPETEMADMEQAVGPLYITRMANPATKNCKIQISTKVLRANVEEANHLLEFVLPFENYVNEYPRGKIQVRGILLQEPWNLLTGQVQGLRDRGLPYRAHLQAHPEEIQHENIPKLERFYKIENHCARILWLLQICQQAEVVTKQGRPLYRQVGRAEMEHLLIRITENQLSSLCTFSFGADYMQTLFQIADTFKYVPSGYFSYPESPAHRRILGL
jgi:hypothetical protein